MCADLLGSPKKGGAGGKGSWGTWEDDMVSYCDSELDSASVEHVHRALVVLALHMPAFAPTSLANHRSGMFRWTLRTKMTMIKRSGRGKMSQ